MRKQEQDTLGETILEETGTRHARRPSLRKQEQGTLGEEQDTLGETILEETGTRHARRDHP